MNVTNTYLIFRGAAPIAFIPSEVRGLWRQVHGSVLVEACSVCNAAVGACCLGADGRPHSATHYARRDAARARLAVLRQQGPYVTIIIQPGGPASSGPPTPEPDVQPQA